MDRRSQFLLQFISYCAEWLINTPRLTHYVAALSHYVAPIRNWLPLLLEDDEHVRLPDFYETWIPRYLDYDFFLHFRLTRRTHNVLVMEIGRHILELRYPGGNLPVPVEKATLITLWYLAKGDTLYSIGDRFNVAASTVHSVITKVLSAMDALLAMYIKWPRREECPEIAEGFRSAGGYPGVIGAIDGCHFRCKIPLAQHDSYQDRKFQHTISMQGICNHKMMFLNVSAGYPGSLHDARILRESNLWQMVIRHGHLSAFYTEDYHLIGDSAYPCKNWLMTPYRDSGSLTRQQRRHNLVLSKTRVIIENAFGQLKGRWRILQYINVYSVSRAVDIIMACCFLHNFCFTQNDHFELDEVEITSDIVFIGPVTDDRNGQEKRDYICSSLSR